MPRLIVNADDFGLTSGINRAILELHQDSVLTSTTLMAREDATQHAIDLCHTAPTLGVGCHVVLVDGDPVAPPELVSTLVDPSTRKLYSTLPAFLSRYLTGRIRSADIEAEATAQIRSLQSRGLRLTHVDSHMHTHMFPGVLHPVLRAARVCGIRSVRNPFEPFWAVRATTSAAFVRTAQVTALRLMRSTWRRIIDQEGFQTTDGTIAVAGTGILDAATLRHLLRQVPEGTWELVTHPGYNDADLDRIHKRTRLRASRDTERHALQALREFPDLQLISFAELDSSR